MPKKMRVSLPFTPRTCQDRMLKGLAKRRFGVIVAHRRAGKTVGMIVHLIQQAANSELKRPRYAYIAPYYRQAKTIAWDYLKHYGAYVTQMRRSESELWVEFHNEGRIRLFGADNPDSLRGQYFDGAVLDEVAQMRPAVWGEIVRPALADRKGWAVFIGTPKGQNLFFELYRQALKDPDWYCGVFRADRTGAVPKAELKAARRNMSEREYRQEFMCDFMAGAEDGFIGFDLVEAAARRVVRPMEYRRSPLVMGVDPARFGDDRSVLAVRRGLALTGLKKWRGIDTMRLAGIVAEEAARHFPDAVFIDAVGLGAGVVDRLRQLGLDPIAVNSGARAADDGRYYNLRAEMWGRMRDWLADGGAIPDDPELRADLLAPLYAYDPRNRIKLERKEDMKGRGLASPDCADALALTFAAPVFGRGERRPGGRGARAAGALELPEWMKG